MVVCGTDCNAVLELVAELAMCASPVHVSKFSSDKVHILSGSDDKTVRYWDLSSERPVHVINGAHKDHVRCGANSPTSPSVRTLALV